jgi:hypothetical protein
LSKLVLICVVPVLVFAMVGLLWMGKGSGVERLGWGIQIIYLSCVGIAAWRRLDRASRTGWNLTRPE